MKPPRELFELMFKGDDRCPIKVGDVIKKSYCPPGDNDLHEIGHIGVVHGSYWFDLPPADANYLSNDAYLVRFKDDPPEVLIFISGRKIKKHGTSPFQKP